MSTDDRVIYADSGLLTWVDLSDRLLFTIQFDGGGHIDGELPHTDPKYGQVKQVPSGSVLWLSISGSSV